MQNISSNSLKILACWGPVILLGDLVRNSQTTLAIRFQGTLFSGSRVVDFKLSCRYQSQLLVDTWQHCMESMCYRWRCQVWLPIIGVIPQV
jgi:hypothetical protein